MSPGERTAGYTLTMQARIKKIMQMDEEVGKLASATPVMICELCRPQVN